VTHLAVAAVAATVALTQALATMAAMAVVGVKVAAEDMVTEVVEVASATALAVAFMVASHPPK